MHQQAKTGAPLRAVRSLGALEILLGQRILAVMPDASCKNTGYQIAQLKSRANIRLLSEGH